MSFRRRPAARILAVAVASTLLAATAATQAPVSPPWLDPYRNAAALLIKTATADDFAWRRLAEMTDTFGSRANGSENLARAIDWAAETMRNDGFENVRTEPVRVPYWVRGHERAEIVGPPSQPLPVLGLGGSAPTPASGIEGDVMVVTGFDDLRQRSAEAMGRIVLYNVPFTTYTDTVVYRNGGARLAAQFGAIAVLVRSIGPAGFRTPHTGSVSYADGVPQIPAAALAVEDAERIARLIGRGQPVRVRLVLDSRLVEDGESFNVVGEIRGRELPDEIVLIGAHIDSWDVGTGASDDGVGCIVTWEALRLMKALGIRPRRTVRVVLWTNEEHGLRGANAYAERYRSQARNHVFALESDSGVFQPAMLGFTGSLEARNRMRDIVTLLAPLGFTNIVAGGGGADVAPIALLGNTPMMAYLGNPERYFALHHSPADTIEHIAPRDVSTAAAAIAVITYLVAEMPQRLAQ